MKKLWGIRHVRYYYNLAHFMWWWHSFASRFFLAPNPSDVQFLNDIWKGKA